ncbi:Receptor protein 12 [Spatholobus suberectus]|nr:Receptor protein 12 [Spatholobus suberectus]
MFIYRFCLFCVVTVLCIYLCIGMSHTKTCTKTDKQALLKLKHGFIHGRHILSSWNGEDCCKWKGISCNNLTGHVTRLDLQCSDYTARLEGKIDSSICELQHLTFLDLSDNYFKGEIPKCIGSLGQLIELKLSINELFGFVPRTLANLSNLQNLDLGNNNLVANDLEWLSHLSNLRYLTLSYINLSRAIDWPSSISKIPHLSKLYLDNCGLPQVNPKSIPHMNTSTSLQILSLPTNQLNSSILSWIFNVSKVLTLLDLSSNSLHSVPNGFANMISLQYLYLSHNELDGSIIKSFRTLRQLKWLLLDSNKLSGHLSDYLPELCSTHDLEVLSLNHNPFNSGPLPDFSKFSSLMSLSLQNTNIVGPLSFDHLPHLDDLDLSLNHLNGSLPIFEVTKFASLYFLDLSCNQLSGTLSYTIGQLSNLMILSPSSNMLKGIISEAYLLSLSRLEILDLSQNSLSFNLNPNWVPPFQLLTLSASLCLLGPQFPTWLKYQRKLEELQISNTSIIDSLPKWFWDISASLSYLNVSHNKLSGVLPKSIPSIKTTYFSIWDFSFNNLSGSVPSFPPDKLALFLSNNMFSGSASFICEMSPSYLLYLDLSSNLLVGPLPDCWEKFQGLTVLNLANNCLSGRIPKSFGTLRQVESMHLNNNNFSGEIPSLTLCRSLKFIDFGDNNLQGTLPTWIGHNLLQLIVLRLRANKIQGNIPSISSLRSIFNLASKYLE